MARSDRPDVVKAAVIEKNSLLGSETIDLTFKREYSRSGYDPVWHFKGSLVRKIAVGFDLVFLHQPVIVSQSEPDRHDGPVGTVPAYHINFPVLKVTHDNHIIRTDVRNVKCYNAYISVPLTGIQRKKRL